MSVSINIKAIKPPRLQVTAIRLEILNALRAEGRDQIRILNRTTSSWTGAKPTFQQKISLDRQMAAVTVFPDAGHGGDKWRWIDQGTRPHVITARRAPMLKFREGYSPATTPRRFSSRPARRSGGWVSKKSVNHPGTAPRGWTDALADIRRVPFEQKMRLAIGRGTRRAFGG